MLRALQTRMGQLKSTIKAKRLKAKATMRRNYNPKKAAYRCTHLGFEIVWPYGLINMIDRRNQTWSRI